MWTHERGASCIGWFWLLDGIVDWMKKTMYKKEGNLSEKDFDLFKVVNTPEDAMSYILKNIESDKKEDINF